MKKKILCLAMTVIMAAGVHTTAFAKDYQGADGWQVNLLISPAARWKVILKAPM